MGLAKTAARTAVVAVLLLAASVLVTPSAAAAKKEEPLPLPTLEAVLAQEFQLSVITADHGVFNATLYVKGSMSFPDRMHGEVVPHGDPVLQEGQTALPCFSRARDFMDDRYTPSVSPDTSVKDGKADAKGAKNPAAQRVERPTLLAFDIKLHHSNSPRGFISVYYLPADPEALVEVREAIQEGSAIPTITASFHFLPERAVVADTPISDVPALARVASSVFAPGGKPEGTERGSEEAASSAAASRVAGDFALRLFSEYEFSVEMRLPTSGDAEAPRLEKVWVHGYTEPSQAVFPRRLDTRPWWFIPAMIAVGSLTSVIQVLTGMTDGKKKAAERKALEQTVAERQKEGQVGKEKKDN